jgi:two-component system LytT family response regulator
MRIRTLIVGGETVARQSLRRQLRHLDSVEVVGESADETTAPAMIRKLSPELVFWDLSVSDSKVAGMLQKLPPGVPALVAVCGSDRHAIRAFEAGVTDYLVKPFTNRRLAQAVGNVTRLRAARHGPGSKIVARSGDDYLFLNPEEVYALEAEGDLVWIITARHRYLATRSLKTLQERLQNTNFRRVHRKALVNLDHVRRIGALSSQRWLLTLGNNREFIVSKRQAHTVRQLLLSSSAE